MEACASPRSSAANEPRRVASPPPCFITPRSAVDGHAPPPSQLGHVERARPSIRSAQQRAATRQATCNAPMGSAAHHRHVGGGIGGGRAGEPRSRRTRGVLALDRCRLQRLHRDDQRHDGTVLERVVQQLEPRCAGRHHLDTGHTGWWRWRGFCEQCQQRRRWSGRRRGTDRRHHPCGQPGCRFRALCQPRLWWWGCEHRRNVGDSRRRGSGGERLGDGIGVADRQRGCRGNGPK